MGLIKFKYIVNSSLKPLIMNTFADIATPDSLVGYVDEGKLANMDSLEHSSLFLTCDCEFTREDDRPSGYKSPIAIVAKNQTEAVQVYNSIYNTDEGVVICELERRCDKLKVIPY